MDAGEVAIEDEHVVAHDPGLDEGLLAVGGQIHRETLTAQPTRDGVGQPQFVFGDQYAHRTSMTGAG